MFLYLFQDNRVYISKKSFKNLQRISPRRISNNQSKRSIIENSKKRNMYRDQNMIGDLNAGADGGVFV